MASIQGSRPQGEQQQTKHVRLGSLPLNWPSRVEPALSVMADSYMRKLAENRMAPKSVRTVIGRGHKATATPIPAGCSGP
jgi:hypothetical protein